MNSGLLKQGFALPWWCAFGLYEEQEGSDQFPGPLTR